MFSYTDCAEINEAMANETDSSSVEDEFNFPGNKNSAYNMCSCIIIISSTNPSDLSSDISDSFTSEDKRKSTSRIDQHGTNTTQSSMMTSYQGKGCISESQYQLLVYLLSCPIEFTSDIEENLSENNQRNAHFKQPPKTASQAAKLPSSISKRQVEKNVAASERNNHPSTSSRTATSQAVVASRRSTHFSKSSKTGSSQAVVVSQRTPQTSNPSKAAAD